MTDDSRSGENPESPAEVPAVPSDDGGRDLIEKVIKALAPRPVVIESSIKETPLKDTSIRIEPGSSSGVTAPSSPPWTLQQFFDGEIDLDVELASRSQNMPVMSTIKFRGLGTRSGRGVATIATADGSAQVIFDADAVSRVVQMSFTYGSMLTLRFALRDLSDMDRSRWLDLMRRDQGGLAFLWGPERWENDYVICIVRKYFTNFYAFSPNNFEAGIRMTPDVSRKLLDWLEDFWKQPPSDDEPPALLTW